MRRWWHRLPEARRPASSDAATGSRAGRPGWWPIPPVLIILLGVPAARAEACSCVRGPDSCAGVATADAVFEATVESITFARSPDAGAASDLSGLLSTARVVDLRDIKPMRGVPESVVVTPADSAACGYPFEAGARYLIVAQRLPDGRLMVSLCGLTRPVSAMGGLEEYVEMIQGDPARTLAWGRVRVPVRWNDFEPDYGPLPGSRVTVDGPMTVTEVTGEDGRYSFRDLPHGTYTVTVDPPVGLPHLGSVAPQEITLPARRQHACAEADFVVPIRGSIAGGITDDSGRPMEGAFVQLHLADQVDRSRGSAGLGITTGPSGEFRFEELPPGRYIVGVNVWNGPMPGWPFAPASARTQAGDNVVVLDPGAHAELQTIVLRRLERVVVPGVVRDESGNPVPDIEIAVSMHGPTGRVYRAPAVRSDRAGRFQIQAWLGERYRVTTGPAFALEGDVEFLASGTPVTLIVGRR